MHDLARLGAAERRHRRRTSSRRLRRPRRRPGIVARMRMPPRRNCPRIRRPSRCRPGSSSPSSSPTRTSAAYPRDGAAQRSRPRRGWERRRPRGHRVTRLRQRAGASRPGAPGGRGGRRDARKIADFGIGTYIRGLLQQLAADGGDTYVAFAPQRLAHRFRPASSTSASTLPTTPSARSSSWGVQPTAPDSISFTHRTTSCRSRASPSWSRFTTSSTSAMRIRSRGCTRGR